VWVSLSMIMYNSNSTMTGHKSSDKETKKRFKVL